METRSNHILVGSITLVLVLAIIVAAFWFSRIGEADNREYDIFFKQSVGGLAKGSNVSYAGVPSGQVKAIELWRKDPDFVRVRISVGEGTPILQGTTATVQGIGFTGVSEIQLDGAVRGAPPITCPEEDPGSACPEGVPVIPTKPGALGELLNSAPQLVERLTTLTERLTETLSDENQRSISGILANTDRLTQTLADRGPEIATTVTEARVAVQQAGDAAEKIAKLADTTNAMLTDDGRPLVADLRQTIAATKKSMAALNATIEDARPGVQAFSQRTMPEVGLLVRDMRRMAQALQNVAEKIDQQGAGSIIGSPALPDYRK
ncbi:MAG TPA: MlaD family protein [Sphingobium sp.]|nr:MlaD family protein [Sphingobium sp.]